MQYFKKGYRVKRGKTNDPKNSRIGTVVKITRRKDRRNWIWIVWDSNTAITSPYTLSELKMSGVIVL